MDNDICDYRAPHGERCVLSYGHTDPHVTYPGDMEPGTDMDVATEFTCHSCGTLVSTVMQHVHLQYHEYVIGLQNRLTEAERRAASLQNDITTLMRRTKSAEQGYNKWRDPPTHNDGSKVYADQYGRYSRDNDVIMDEPFYDEEPLIKPKLSRKEATNILARPVKRRRDKSNAPD